MIDESKDKWKIPMIVPVRKKLKVFWFSGGIDSFVAAYLVKDEIDKFVYIHIDDQHEDTLRFVKDCENILGKPIEIIQSRYKTVDEIQKTFQFIASAHGAKCTVILKKRVRKEWEAIYKEYDLIYYWGFDINEMNRTERLLEAMPEFEHRFPLQENNMTKQDCHGFSRNLGVKRPYMYDLGYSNNNCIGCVKGGIGYWNKIRVDFPERYNEQAERERQIGHTCLHDKNGPIYLDELDPKRGRMEDEIMEDCSIFCQLAINESETIVGELKAELTCIEADDLWVKGTVGKYLFEAKVYDLPSMEGILNGRISKLWIAEKSDKKKCICNYDRQWDIEPEQEHEKKYHLVIELLENAPLMEERKQK